MPEARHPSEEQLDRSQAAAQPAAGDSPAAAHSASAAASATSQDGLAGGREDERGPTADDRAGGGAAQEQPDGRAADEDALKGDVDELVAVAAQRDEYLALAQRTQADFENYRKRVAKESVAAQERGVAKLATELLPALDNLDRALAEANAAAEQGGSQEALLEGVRLVRSELHAALARVGIESFSPKGEAFDPSQHEAMAQKPEPGASSGTVVEVFQPGYRLGQSIIRPARVVVAA